MCNNFSTNIGMTLNLALGKCFKYCENPTRGLNKMANRHTFRNALQNNFHAICANLLTSNSETELGYKEHIKHSLPFKDSQP